MIATGDGVIHFDYGVTAANTLGLRSGTIAQTYQVYNTFTDASNYERGIFDWNVTANTLTIGSQSAGTGTARNVLLGPLGNALLAFRTGGNTRWLVNGPAGGHLQAGTDNTYDIGDSGAAGRPRNVYIAGAVNVAAAALTATAGQISYGSTTAAAANCNVAVPTPTACIVVNVAGTVRYIPYY